MIALQEAANQSTRVEHFKTPPSVIERSSRQKIRKDIVKLSSNTNQRNLTDIYKILHRDFPGGTVIKNPPANAGTRVRSLLQKDPTCHRVTKPMRHNY